MEEFLRTILPVTLFVTGLFILYVASLIVFGNMSKKYRKLENELMAKEVENEVLKLQIKDYEKKYETMTTIKSAEVGLLKVERDGMSRYSKDITDKFKDYMETTDRERASLVNLNSTYIYNIIRIALFDAMVVDNQIFTEYKDTVNYIYPYLEMASKDPEYYQAGCFRINEYCLEREIDTPKPGNKGEK